MKIRSITCFFDPTWPLQQDVLHQVETFVDAARRSFEVEGYEVQSTRLAGSTFTRVIPTLDKNELIQYARTLEDVASGIGIQYVSLGPALPDRLDAYSIIPDILAATQNVFLSGLMTTPDGGISLPSLHACARVIHRAAPLAPDGFTNLRFGALANIPPGGPFLPGAYHRGGPPAFALALEAAGLAVEAVTQADTLIAARQNLINAVEENARRLVHISEQLSKQFSLSFSGLDFTLAPFPEPTLSFGEAMERLGIPAVGLHGSLAAAAFLTDSLDRAQFPRVGFNGLMLPVMEDAILARRAAEGILTLKDLLLYAAVCGAGLDTVPLPGDISEDQLFAILLDVASLAQRLDKPLIARLMPIPGKKAGDRTEFDFTYFANSRVLGVDAMPLHNLFAGSETFDLKPRRHTA